MRIIRSRLEILTVLYSCSLQRSKHKSAISLEYYTSDELIPSPDEKITKVVSQMSSGSDILAADSKWFADYLIKPMGKLR